MPTAAELQIVIEAQDRASAQLRQIGGEVQRLERQVEGVQRSTRGGGLLGGLQLGAGFQAAQQAFGALGGLVDFVRSSVFDLNSSLEQSVVTFQALTGSVQAAGEVVAALRREAATSPFSDADTIAAGRALIPVADGSTESLLHLVRVAEQLAAIDPAQGLVGGAAALREAVSGNFQSIAERFELSRESLQRFREQGLTNLQAVEAELARLGVSSELVERLGRTFEGRMATVRSFGDELRQRLGQGVFERVGDFLGRVVNLITEYGDRLRAWADQVGEFLGAVLEGVASRFVTPLLGLLERLAPGITELFQGAMAQAPQQMERFAQATGQAAQHSASLELRLARAGVAGAELQLQAERLNRAYQDQLQPLERQLRALQQSTDLQRVQNALATNRATVERLRLDQEIAALQEAAGGATDPNAPGLSLQQRVIALALQERQLRREELGLEEERRPVMQSLQDQIARIQEQQRDALKPLQDRLAIQKDIVAQLGLERAEAERNKLEAEDAAAGAGKRAWQTLGGADALATAKQRGQELADEWLKGWQQWIEQGGGTIGGAIGKSL